MPEDDRKEEPNLLTVAGFQTMSLHADKVGDVEDEFDYRLGVIAREDGRLILLARLEVAGDDMRAMTVVSAVVLRPDEMEIDVESKDSLEKALVNSSAAHILYDAAASNVRYLVSSLNGKIEIPFETPEPSIDPLHPEEDEDDSDTVETGD